MLSRKIYIVVLTSCYELLSFPILNEQMKWKNCVMFCVDFKLWNIRLKNSERMS